MGETDSGAEGLVKYYVKPDELFCVALKVCTGHHLFSKLGLSFWKYEVCPSLDINLNLFATNFPLMSLEGPLSPLARCIILPFVMHFVPDLVVVLS